MVFMMMRTMPALLLGLIVCQAIAGHRGDLRINSGTELRDWCKEASEESLIGRGLTPFNWTASYWDQADTLMVKGQWRISDSAVTVECSIARGGEAQSASLSITDAP
jgi:hypothetical protein